MLLLIGHRNKVLNDSGIALNIPGATTTQTEMEVLEAECEDIVNKKGEYYDGFYFPAPSKCYAFEPNVTNGRKLADKFKAHRWWLPSYGERDKFCVPVALYYWKNDNYGWKDTSMYRACEDKVFPTPVSQMGFHASTIIQRNTSVWWSGFFINSNNQYGGSTYFHDWFNKYDFNPICKF